MQAAFRRWGRHRTPRARTPIATRARRRVVAVALLAATACGSTVGPLPPDDSAARQRPDELRAGSPEIVGGGTATALSPRSLSVTARRSGGGRPPSTGQAGPTVGALPAGGTIDIGLVQLEDSGTINARVGVQLDFGDTNRQQRILLDDINRRGGVGGRRLRPVYFRVSEQTSESYASLEQRACATWTEDGHVFAVLAHPLVGTSDNLRSCLEKRGVIVIGGLDPADVDTYRQFPHYVGTGSPELQRQAHLLIDVLVEQRYFGPDAVAGLLTYDMPAFRRAADRVIAPRLEARGVPLATTAYVNPPQSTASVADMQAAIAAAALRMRSDGVTHVIVLDVSGGLTYTFMQTAENQRYRPRYGLTTGSGGQLTATLVPKAQLEDAVTAGWLPVIDVGPAAPGGAAPGFGECAQLMRHNGEMLDSSAAQRAASHSCDVFSVFAGAMAASPSAHADAFIAGLDRLGNTVPSAQVLSLRYGPGRRDGVDAVRATVFDAGCGCFGYVGPLKVIG